MTKIKLVSIRYLSDYYTICHANPINGMPWNVSREANAMALFDKLFSLKRRLDSDDTKDRSRYVRRMFFIHYFYFWAIWHASGWRTKWALVSEFGSPLGHRLNLPRWSVDARDCALRSCAATAEPRRLGEHVTMRGARAAGVGDDRVTIAGRGGSL